MGNVYQFPDFLRQAGVSGMRPGGLIWSPYHPREAIHQRGQRDYGAGLVFQQNGLAHWNIVYAVTPQLQRQSPVPVSDSEIYNGFVLLQFVLKQELDGLPMQDQAGCLTLRQFISQAERHPDDLDRWSRSSGWPSGFDPHGWVQSLKRLT